MRGRRLFWERKNYARRAERAAEFVLDHLLRDGRLLRSYKSGKARHNGYLDDYAFLIAALLDLYEAAGEPRWLQEAIDLDRVLENRYEDKKNGGFFMTSDDHEQLLAREKPSYDGAEPAGNSVAVMNLLRLHELTTDDRYRQRAVRAFRAFEKIFTRSPAALSEMLLALDFHLDTAKEIVIVTPRSREEAEPMLARLRETFVPNRILSVATEGDGMAAHVKLVPLLEDKTALKGKPTALRLRKAGLRAADQRPGNLCRANPEGQASAAISCPLAKRSWTTVSIDLRKYCFEAWRMSARAVDLYA